MYASNECVELLSDLAQIFEFLGVSKCLCHVLTLSSMTVSRVSIGPTRLQQMDP
jgi:hypothetical protein